MNDRHRLNWPMLSLLVVVFLVFARFSDQWTVNRAMVQLSHCLMPIGWVSDPDRARLPDNRQPVPTAFCLDRVRQQASSSRRVLARLELIAGDIATNGERWLDAVTHYRNAAQLVEHPTPGIWNGIVGIYLWKLKDYETALTMVLQALQSSPEDQELRARAAMLYLYYIPPYSNYTQAITVMRPELGFTEPYYYNIAAGSFLALGQLDNGLQMAQEAVRLSRAMNDHNLATGLYLLGLMQRCMGQSDSGIANLREALALSPQDEKIKAALAKDISGLCKPSRPRK